MHENAIVVHKQLNIYDPFNINIFHQVGTAVQRHGNAEEDDYILLIVAPLAAGLIFVSVLGLMVFVSIARKRRSEHGTYNPQKLEMQAPRLELHMMMKPPNEERLI